MVVCADIAANLTGMDELTLTLPSVDFDAH